MMKISSTILIILTCSFLFAQQTDFHSFMNSLLDDDSDYQQVLHRFEQEKALLRIDRSLNIFDVNLAFQKYDNDIDRDETIAITTLENTKIAEIDERWRLELNKQFFPKDFDIVADAIGFKIDILRFEQELILARYIYLSEIFDEMREWHEAHQMIELLQERLDILYQQNQILEELDLDNTIDPETLIENLERIDDREDDLYDFKEIDSVYQRKYGNILEEFYNQFQIFKKQNTDPDTILFEQNIKYETTSLNKSIKGISKKIKFNYYHYFLPEMNLSLSYNWRKTNQDWDITKNGNYENMTRKQIEEFPEGEIEFSLPFNIFSNASGKLALLKAYERELLFRSKDMNLAWQKFKIEKLNFYHAARHELKRKTRLKELYVRNLNILHQKYQEEPSLLGTNPELKLKKETIKTAEAEIEYQLAEMKLYKEIFLINCFGEKAK